MERDDITKFKKTCEVLKKEKNYTEKTIAEEMGISDVHVKNILRDKVLIRASTLGMIQDFNKWHRTDLAYAGLSIKKAIEQTKSTDEDFAKADMPPQNIKGKPGEVDPPIPEINNDTKSVSEGAKKFLKTEKARKGTKDDPERKTMKEMHDKAREEREKNLLNRIFPGIILVCDKADKSISKTINFEIELRIRLKE